MKKIILDCDPGMDDSMAIVMAAKASDLELLAVTTVNGNYPVDVTCVNARKVLEMIGRSDIPVARGMANPMVRPSPRDPFTPWSRRPGRKFSSGAQHAAVSAARSGYDYLACQTISRGDHRIMHRSHEQSGDGHDESAEIKGLLKGVIAISGAFGLNRYAFANATGDTPQSEWNVYVDPEAAQIVYASGTPLVALGLDVATHFDVNFSEEDIGRSKRATFRRPDFCTRPFSLCIGGGLRRIAPSLTAWQSATR